MVSLDSFFRFGYSWTRILVLIFVMLPSHPLLAKNPELDNGQLNTGDPWGGGRRPDEVCAGGGWVWAGGQYEEESIEIIYVPLFPLFLFISDYGAGGRRLVPDFPFRPGREESRKWPFWVIGEAGG